MADDDLYFQVCWSVGRGVTCSHAHILGLALARVVRCAFFVFFHPPPL
jgi:hypothetical protein